MCSYVGQALFGHIKIVFVTTFFLIKNLLKKNTWKAEGDVLGVPLGRVGVAHRDGVHGRAVPAEHRHGVRPRSPRLVAREQGVRVRLRVAGDEPAQVRWQTDIFGSGFP